MPVRCLRWPFQSIEPANAMSGLAQELLCAGADGNPRLPAHVSEQTHRPEEVRSPACEYAALAAGSFAQMPIVPNGALFAACTHVQVDGCAGDHA